MQNGKKCLNCGKPKADSAFFRSSSQYHKDGLVPICRKCIIDAAYDPDTGEMNIEGFKEMLRQVDKPFIKSVLDSAERQLETDEKISPKSGRNRIETIVGSYFKNLNSLKQYKLLTWEDSKFTDDDTATKNAVYVGKSKLFSDIHMPKDLRAMEALYECLVSHYHIKNEQQKALLASYIENRVISELFIADNLTAEFDDARQFADHDLIKLKQSLATNEDIDFAEFYTEYCNVKDGEWPWTD